MENNDSKQRSRLLLFFIFAAAVGFLFFNLFKFWAEIDSEEICLRVIEMLLIGLGAWVVVWPETFPTWHSRKHMNAPDAACPDVEKDHTETPSLPTD
ncbi:MAG TPA: hypothetical protein VG097_10460 [Gemmata sp.]|nr:hypothetical protein [Gemmata sp.]